jgi:hypothetical protein
LELEHTVCPSVSCCRFAHAQKNVKLNLNKKIIGLLIYSFVCIKLIHLLDGQFKLQVLTKFPMAACRHKFDMPFNSCGCGRRAGELRGGGGKDSGKGREEDHNGVTRRGGDVWRAPELGGPGSTSAVERMSGVRE